MCNTAGLRKQDTQENIPNNKNNHLLTQRTKILLHLSASSVAALFHIWTFCSLKVLRKSQQHLSDLFYRKAVGRGAICSRFILTLTRTSGNVDTKPDILHISVLKHLEGKNQDSDQLIRLRMHLMRADQIHFY